MTINSTTRKAGPFVGNGTVSAFPFGFKVFQASDLFVVRLNVSAAVEQTLVLNSDYSVTLNPDQNSNPGGVVTLSSALASGYTLTLTSDVPDTQPTDLTNQGGFYPEVINDALDRATIQIQQLQEETDRTITAPISTPSNVNLTFPYPAANQFIGWNSSGTGLQNLDGTSLASIVAFATAYADTFNGDGITATFALSSEPATVRNLDVSINGVTQVPVIDYDVTGQALTFTTPPPSGSVVLVKYWQALPNMSGDSQDIRYVPDGAGAVQTDVQTKLREYVSVKDFGAVGDGVTDDTAAIQAALDSGVKTIYFTSGSYGLSAAVNVTTSGQKLIGYGAEIVALSPGVGGFTIGFNGSAFSKTDDISVVGFTFTGANTSGSSASGAITVYPPTTNPYVEGGGCSYISISDCKFTGFTFGVIATAADNIRVTNCAFEGLVFHPALVTGGYGVLAQTCFDVLVSNNTFTGVAGDRHAVYISKNASRPVGPNNVCKRVVVSNNIVDWTNVTATTGFESCLQFRGTYDLTVTGNILKNGYGAIDYVVTDGAGENIVIGDNVMHVRSAGVSSRAGVTFFGSVPSGFVAKNVAIANNSVYLYGPKAYGFVLLFSDNLNITGNTIRSEAAASDCLGIAFQNNNKVVLGSNIVELAGGGRAIYFQGSVDQITVDRQQLSGVGYLQFDAAVGAYPTNITFNYPRRFSISADGAGNITVANVDQPEVVSSATSSANGVVVDVTPWLTNTDAYNFGLGAPASQVGWVYHRAATPGVSVEIGVVGNTQSALSVPPPALPAATNIYSITGVVYS